MKTLGFFAIVCSLMLSACATYTVPAPGRSGWDASEALASSHPVQPSCTFVAAAQYYQIRSSDCPDPHKPDLAVGYQWGCGMDPEWIVTVCRPMGTGFAQMQGYGLSPAPRPNGFACEQIAVQGRTVFLGESSCRNIYN